MVAAFVIIGAATTLMYLSAVTTCAKNFGKGKHKGLALASPIAAFGLSGMWQSQVGSRILYEKRPDGSRGDVDVFRFFVFLAVTLLAEEARKKTWLLNEETRRFLKDHTMWWLTAGFFFVSGPGEAFITNLGTIIGTLYPRYPDPYRVPTSAATHVSIVAVTSTIARILFGTLTDLLAPSTNVHHYASVSNSLASLPPRLSRFSISRVTFLLVSAIFLSIGQVVLASGLIQGHAERFWIASSLIGSGYGALFSLTPLIVSVIWGLENFGTNWGIVAMVPAAGATFWGVQERHSGLDNVP
ncbi:hypothetical protein BUE80_DR013605 [Diplocarpon rosae]|nr:hypothetical protein BUE80_DR013605 [Diplocarpon rosae]